MGAPPIATPYLSPDALAERTATLAAAAGGACRTFGHTRLGAPLVAVRVPGPHDHAPRVLCCANIHGPELIGTLVALGLLHALAPGGAAAPLRERAEVWIVPSLNPDGLARTWSADGDAPLAVLRANAGGVDLNRNFPLPGGARPRALPGAGSSRPGDATYRGPSPLSEPETRSLDALLREQQFHAGANLHSFMGTVIPARVTDRRWFATYRELCRAFADAQPHTRYRRLSARVLDVFTGEQEDHQHHVHDCWAVCVETFPLAASLRQHLRAPSTFWRFNPHDPARWIDNDVPGLLAYFLAALQRPRPSACSARPTPSGSSPRSRATWRTGP